MDPDGGSHQGPRRDADRPFSLERERLFAGLGVITLAALAVAVRSYRLDDPIGGFQAANEAFYVVRGLKDAARPLAAALLAPQDRYNPPLFALMVAAAFKAFGPGVAAARAVSVAASGITVLYVYALGRALYNARIAVLAAAAYAFMPGVVLVGRNAQIDTLFVLLSLAATFHYVKAVKSASPVHGALAGAALGLALVTKLPAVLVPPALVLWQRWRTGGWAWVRKRVTLVAVAVFTAVGVPWWVYRMVFSPSYASTQRYLFTQFRLPTAYWAYRFFVSELVWMVSPFVLALGVGGTVLAARRLQPADKLLLGWLGVQLAFYLIYHVHTYYLLAIAPFAALAAARLVNAMQVRSWPIVAMAAAVLLAAELPFATAALSAKKWAAWSPGDVGHELVRRGVDPAATDVYVEDHAFAEVDEGVRLYLPRAQKVGEPAFPPTHAAAGRRQALVAYMVNEASPRAFTRVRVRAVYLGYAVSQDEDRGTFNSFMAGPWRIERVGPPWRFGVDARRYRDPLRVLLVR